MEANLSSTAEWSNTTTWSTTFIWCYLIPLIHVFSLISNILCIIVFCSNVFIKKPIAIYFICLLLSDSIILLVGYADITDRKSHHLSDSGLCLINKNILHTWKEHIFTLMERFCLEWILYKILWLRVSTILLAILSIQRTRTFFSLSYHESRFCAFSACVFSFILALIITCFEWNGIHHSGVINKGIYREVFHKILDDNSSKELYSTILHRSYDQAIDRYPCLMEPFDVASAMNMTNQFNCSSGNITDQFASLTKSLLSNQSTEADSTAQALLSIRPDSGNVSDQSILKHDWEIAQVSDFVLKLFDSRSCQIKINYTHWLDTYNFFNTVSLQFSRRTIAIFFGNALPSFIVVVANLLSIKVIYFSKSLKYLKRTTRKNRRKRRLQNDLRAFLVILIESFLVIMIAWAIPVFLTMYHCSTLYVVSAEHCPKIKDYLVLFLFTDLFSSSTNCLLYSLSGKLFRRRLLCILKTILVCGRGALWNVKQNSMHLSHHPLDRQLSNNPSTNTINNNYHCGLHSSRPGSYRPPGRFSSPTIPHQNRNYHMSMRTTTTTTTSHHRTNGTHRNVSDDSSYSIGKLSNDCQYGKNSLSDIESDVRRHSREVEPRKSSQSIGSFLMDKVRSLGSTSSASSKAPSDKRSSALLTVEKSKRRLFTTIRSKNLNTADFSCSSSSITGSGSCGSQRKYPTNARYSLTKAVLATATDSPSVVIDDIQENLTSL